MRAPSRRNVRSVFVRAPVIIAVLIVVVAADFAPGRAGAPSRIRERQRGSEGVNCLLGFIPLRSLFSLLREFPRRVNESDRAAPEYTFATK